MRSSGVRVDWLSEVMVNWLSDLLAMRVDWLSEVRVDWLSEVRVDWLSDLLAVGVDWMIVAVLVMSNPSICGQNRSSSVIRWCWRWISQHYWRFLLRFIWWDFLLEVWRTEILRWWCSYLLILIHLVFAENFVDAASECWIHLIWNRSQFIPQNLSEIALTNCRRWYPPLHICE